MKKAILFAALTAAFFSLLEPVSKLISGDVDPFMMTALRFLVGALALAPFAVAEVKKHAKPLGKKQILVIALLGLLMVCISMPMLQTAVQKSHSPALIAIVFSANSLFTIFLSAVILHEKITPLQWIAAGLCTVGVLICAMPINGDHIGPVLLSLVAAMTFSLYTILTKKHLSQVGNILKLTLSFVFGGTALLLFLVSTDTGLIITLDLRVVFNLLVLGVLVTGMGYFAYFKALELGGAYTAAFAFFIKPVLAPLAAYWISGSLPSANVLAAIPFIVAGSFLNAYSARKQEACRIKSAKGCI